MTHHPSPNAGRSQCQMVLEHLTRHQGAWVSMVELHRVSGSMAVHSRISDLRRNGHTIEQRSTRHGRTIHSDYRLLP